MTSHGSNTNMTHKVWSTKKRRRITAKAPQTKPPKSPLAKAIKGIEKLVDIAQRNYDARIVHVDNLAPLRMTLSGKRKKRAIVAYWEQHGYVSHKRLCEIAGVDRIMDHRAWRRLKEQWLSGKIMGRM